MGDLCGFNPTELTKL